MKYTFYIDEKIVDLYRTKISIEADSEQKAIDKINSFIEYGEHVNFCQWTDKIDTIGILETTLKDSNFKTINND